MLVPYLSSPRSPSEATDPLLIASPSAPPSREPLRHILLGSRAGVRQAINSLHVLNYVEQGLWSQLITVPSSGIVMTPEEGEVMSYLIRWRSRELLK
ncbi:MAG: hypothetical protein ACFE0I_22500 [Elainellaceae cyanobacterium]